MYCIGLIDDKNVAVIIRTVKFLNSFFYLLHYSSFLLPMSLRPINSCVSGGEEEEEEERKGNKGC